MTAVDDKQLIGRVNQTPLFWEGYGLSDQNSGVGVCGHRLEEALQSLGIHPRIISPARSGLLRYKPLTSVRSLWMARKLSNAKEGGGPGILHGLSNFNIPPTRFGRGTMRFVLTVHDLIPLTHPQFVSSALHQQMKILIPLAFAAADRIVCSSKFTEAVVHELFPQVRNKCVFVPLGREKPQIVRAAPESSNVRLLSVSRDEPYKQLDLTLAIIAQAPSNWRLTLVTNAQGCDRLRQVARSMDVGDRVELLSGVPAENLKELYKAADVYIHPSLVEGYCLPAVEALGFGKPVVFRAGTVLEETVGPCGVPVRSDAQAPAWSDAVGAAVALANNLEFIRKLTQFSDSSFSWLDCAFGYAKVYDNLV